MDRTTASGTTPRRTPRGAGGSLAVGRVGGRAGAGRAAGQAGPTRAPHPTAPRGTAQQALMCSGCGRGGRTRDEAADLAVDWLVVEAGTAPFAGAVHTARFHQDCRPAGIPGEFACAVCGDGPLLDPTLTTVLAGTGGAVDLFTAAALTGWLHDHGWSGDLHPASHSSDDPDAGEGPRCPACSPRPARPHTTAAAGAAR